MVTRFLWSTPFLLLATACAPGSVEDTASFASDKIQQADPEPVGVCVTGTSYDADGNVLTEHTFVVESCPASTGSGALMAVKGDDGSWAYTYAEGDWACIMDAIPMETWGPAAGRNAETITLAW